MLYGCSGDTRTLGVLPGEATLSSLTATLDPWEKHGEAWGSRGAERAFILLQIQICVYQ